MPRKKKQEQETRLIPEQDGRICGTICLCQGVLVLSCVAIVYLTVAVYVPTWKAHTGKISETPVMCTTLTTRILNGSASCSEWCLSKGGAGLTQQIFVHLRRNGTALTFENCTMVYDKECGKMSMENEKSKYACKVKSRMLLVNKTDPDTNKIISQKRVLVNENACANLSGLFVCNDGNCTAVTGKLQCTTHKQTEHKLTCSMLKIGSYVVFECSAVTGIYNCTNGTCFLMHDPVCHRICFNIPTRNKNVILLSGNRMFAAMCSSAHNYEDESGTNGTLVWDDSEDTVLMASCLEIVNNSMGNFETSDCVNATIFEKNVLDPFVNFTSLTHLHHNLSLSNPAPHIAPLETNLTITSEVKLQINQEGCVNTLKDECHDFYKNYSANGSDYNAVMR